MLEKLQLMTLMFVGDLKARREERGATAVEYGLLVVLIAAVIVGAVMTLGDNILGGFDTVNEKIGGTETG